MTKLILLVAAIALLFFGWQWYSKKRANTAETSPVVTVDNNSEVANQTTLTLHCVANGDINAITTRNYSLLNEVYTPAVKLLECSYQNGEMVDNVFPTISYKIQFTNDANGIWSRKQNSLQSSPSYKDSSDYSTAFANLNPVHELDQGTFYGQTTGRYIELTYTPVSEGADPLFSRGMRLLEKALNN